MGLPDTERSEGASGVRVTVRLFAMLRERAGASEVELELPAGARVSDALDELRPIMGGLQCVLAVNREYARPDDPIGPGDELALVPPVSGGEAADVHVAITADRLDPAALSRRVVRSAAGAIVTFQGITREVERLDYEAYTEMAEARMREIAVEVAGRHGACALAVEHRVGEVGLSEPSVVVAASGPHRDEAFGAARELIDRVKAEAPIWKREVEGSRAEWATGSLPGSREG